jgi:putative heme degradation protein
MAGKCKFRLDDGQIEVVDDMVAQILRTKTPAERVEMIFDCNRTMRQIVTGGVRHRHPDWQTAQVVSEVARRMSHGSK